MFQDVKHKMESIQKSNAKNAKNDEQNDVWNHTDIVEIRRRVAKSNKLHDLCQNVLDEIAEFEEYLTEYFLKKSGNYGKAHSFMHSYVVAIKKLEAYMRKNPLF